MSKPTLFQSILGRPSQSYHFPSSREYHSTKPELLRAASATGSTTSEGRPQSTVTAPDSESGYFSSSSTGSLYSDAKSRPESTVSSSRPPRGQKEAVVSAAPTASSSSRRPSRDRPPIASSQSSTSTRSETFGSTTSTPPSSSHSNSTPKPPLSLTPAHFSQANGKVKHSPVRTVHAVQPRRLPSKQSQSSDTDDDDVFYTPTSSVYSSPHTSRTSAAMLIDPRVLTNALQGLPSTPLLKSRSKSSIRSKHSHDGLHTIPEPQEEPLVIRTSSESSFSSTSSSSSGGGTVGSIESSSRATSSTRMTSPVTSNHNGSTRAESVSTITIARSHSKSQSTSGATSGPAPVRGQPRPLAATRRRSIEPRRNTYTDEDWAKDVRWLAPVISARSDSPRKNTRPLPPEFDPRNQPVAPPVVNSRQQPPPPTTQRSYPPPAKSAEHRRRSRRSRGSRSSRGRMSALMEEDESEYSDVTPGGSSAEPSRAPSPVQEEASPPSTQNGHNQQLPALYTPPASSLSRARSQRSAKEPSVSSSDEAAESPDARLQAYAAAQAKGQPRRSYSHTHRLSRSISPTLFSFSQTLPTHSIPTPTPFQEDSSNGHTGLTLPHAAYSNNGKADIGDGKVDLVRAGLAQSSMATIEVTRGVAEHAGSGDARKKKRTFSFQLTLKLLDVKVGKSSRGKGKNATPAHLLDSLPLPVAYVLHLPPPSYVPSSYVLIQVYAVGLDSLDSLLVQEKLGNGAKGTGFIPGRSIVGKVVEVGWEVKGDVCKKNEWVIGLLDVRKCGALAEFVVLDRHRIHRAPQPLSRPTTLFPPTRRSHVRSKSLPSQMNVNRHPYAQLHQDLVSSMNMTIEELALLPLCALPAHRAIRTMTDVIAPSKPRPNADDGRSQKLRALVLMGHDGPGALAVQMLARRGVRIWVQVPDSAARDDMNEQDDEDSDTSASVHGTNGARSRPRQTRFDKLEARLRGWGAEELCVGEPLEVLERLADQGRSFDVVLDTVGGVDIWETSRKLLLADPELDTTLQISPKSPNTPSTTTSSTPSKASSSSNNKKVTLTQFTTLVGDHPSRPVPTAQDNLRSGFRSIKRTMTTTGSRSRSGSVSPNKSSASIISTSPSKDSLGLSLRRSSSLTRKSKVQKRTVNYAWVSSTVDLDFEGEDIRDSLGAIVSMVEQGWIKPWAGDEDNPSGHKVVPFDKAPEVFRRDGEGPVGLLQDGGTCVVKVVA